MRKPEHPGRSITALQQSSQSFPLCVEDGGMEDLEARKVHQTLTDREAAREGYIRVVDSPARTTCIRPTCSCP
jgi:hypothetical protein